MEPRLQISAQFVQLNLLVCGQDLTLRWVNWSHPRHFGSLLLVIFATASYTNITNPNQNSITRFYVSSLYIYYISSQYDHCSLYNNHTPKRVALDNRTCRVSTAVSTALRGWKYIVRCCIENNGHTVMSLQMMTLDFTQLLHLTSCSQ